MGEEHRTFLWQILLPNRSEAVKIVNLWGALGNLCRTCFSNYYNLQTVHFECTLESFARLKL